MGEGRGKSEEDVVSLAESRAALADFWRSYRWPTRITVFLVVLSLLWGAAAAGWPEIAAGLPRIVLALLSDPTRTLLTLLGALFIAIHFHVRARRGVLDGDEHYNIARALAFGYFKNFLVPALQLAERDSRTVKVFRPRSMHELRLYSAKIEPKLRALFEHEWRPVVDTPTAGGPPRRTVLALQAPKDPSAGGEPFYFDAPTALFTVDDFYAALNRRREDQHKVVLDPKTVLKNQNGQIESFFVHLDFLFERPEGFAAVADIVHSRERLAELRTQLRTVGYDELATRYGIAQE